MLSFSTNFRAAPAPADVLEQLKYLKSLTGTWVGNGFSLISVPSRNSNPPFRLKLNATKEILTFTPVGAPIPNRGSKEDIYFPGLHYFQQVSDAVDERGLAPGAGHLAANSMHPGSEARRNRRSPEYHTPWDLAACAGCRCAVQTRRWPTRDRGG